MIYVAVSVLDLKVGAFSAPVFLKSKGEAIRVFGDSCKDREIAFYKHPEDYVLHYVGEFDDSTGKFSPELPIRMISGDEVEGLRSFSPADVGAVTPERVERLRRVDGGGG